MLVVGLDAFGVRGTGARRRRVGGDSFGGGGFGTGGRRRRWRRRRRRSARVEVGVIRAELRDEETGKYTEEMGQTKRREKKEEEPEVGRRELSLPLL